MSITTIPNIFSDDPNPKPPVIKVLHFKLRHGEKIEIPVALVEFVDGDSKNTRKATK